MAYLIIFLFTTHFNLVPNWPSFVMRVNRQEKQHQINNKTLLI